MDTTPSPSTPSSYTSPMTSPTSSPQGEPGQSSSTSAMDISSLPSSLLASLPSLPSSTSPATGSEPAHDHGLFLTVPLEVLERILRYTFLRQTKLTPSSDPRPLRRTTQLLLVSKGFRELCLPFFFEHLTITRPSDYVTFFDPQNGLFVTGEEGKSRWTSVKALAFACGVEPPSVLPRVEGQSWIVPLRVPEGAVLQEIAILNKELRSTITNEPELHAMDLALEDSETRARALAEVEDQFYNSPYFDSGGRQIEEWCKSTFGHSVEEEIRDSIQHEAKEGILFAREDFYDKLLQAEPRSRVAFRLSNSLPHFQYLRTITIGMGLLPWTRLAFHHNSKTPPSSPNDDRLLANAFAELRTLMEVKRIQISGYPKGEIPPFLLKLLDEKKERWCFVLGRGNDLFLVREKYFIKHQASDIGRYRRVDKSMELELRGLAPILVQPEGRDWA